MRIAIVGGGAAGLFLAGLLDKEHRVTILEKNSSFGKKLKITGKGRCNVTNNKLPVEFLQNVMVGAEFLTSAIQNFTPQGMIEYLQIGGVNILEEDSNRIYPKSNKSQTIIDFLENKLGDNVKVVFDTTVESITHTSIIKSKNENLLSENLDNFITMANNHVYNFNAVIIATGGATYSTTGSRGDGYKFAMELGHSITSIRPSLVGLKLRNFIFQECQGTSFEAKLKIYENEQSDNQSYYKTAGEDTRSVLAESSGSVMITNFGIGGPSVQELTARYLQNDITNKTLVIDFVPQVDVVKLKKEIESYRNKNIFIFEWLCNYLPKKMAKVICDVLVLHKVRCATLSYSEQNRVVELLKNYKANILGFDSMERATVTRGGVSLHEINPLTMESKILPNLFFMGEVLNCDALSGGYSLQICWSTAKLVADKLNDV